MSFEAVVSIGTNSTRLVIADLSISPPQVTLARTIGTRIGEGLRERGRLSDAAIWRTLEAVREHVRMCEEAGATPVHAIATSALRRAENAAGFAREVERIAGVPLHVLSGEEEGLASYRGAVSALDPAPHRTIGVLDVGGGSTELAVGEGVVPEHVVSCEVGAVRLTEICPQLGGEAGAVPGETVERARRIVRALLAPIGALPRVETLAIVGGSASTTVSLLRGAFEESAPSQLSRGDLGGLLRRLCALPLAERKALPGMNPQRADILPAGMIVLDEIFECLGLERAIVTQSDLLLGYLLIRHESDPPLIA